MSSRIPSHQLSGGLYVSGRPDTPLTRPPSLPPRAPALVYTGGDVKLSGDLGKMFEIPTTSDRPKPTKPISGSSQTRPTSGQTGLITSDRQPDPINPGGKTGYGPNSGQIGPTGLITSGRQPDQTNPDGKMVYGPAVTDLRKSNKMRVSRAGVWVVVGAVMVVAMVAAFVAVVAKKASVVAAVVAAAVGVAAGVVTWNLWWKRKGVVGYWKGYADVELRGAVDGQYVKVTGVVTCGSIPLETSFQRVPRCVYASTELYEYRGWGGKSANPKHRFFSWGCRQAEKYVADFYISDFQSGLRALVKSGYGAKVSVFVEPTTVVDITKDNRDSSPSFLCWLSDRSLSSDDRIMRLKEGYIKEGSTVSVLGIVRRHDNVLMIVPPTEPVSTRCQWFRCLFPTYSEGLILLCDESQTADVIAV